MPKVTVAPKVLGDYTNNTKIQSLIEAHLVYNGKVTGRRYEWFKSGDTVSVEPEDVPELLSKHLGGQLCCGNSVGNNIFQIVN